MDNTIEKITSETILQDAQIINVKGVEYRVAPPTTATLIEVSKYISQIPDITIDKDGNIIMEVLAYAENCECFGDIVAILILGKKYLITEEKRFFGLIKKKRNNQKILAQELLLNLSAEELNSLMLEIFKMLKVDFFFSISTFLKEINLLRKTKQIETIVSGQQ